MSLYVSNVLETLCDHWNPLALVNVHGSEELVCIFLVSIDKVEVDTTLCQLCEI